MVTPYECAANILLLMLLYSLLMAFIMLLFHLWKGQLAGMVSVFGFSLFGFLLSPDTIKTMLKLSEQEGYVANIIVGWVSPLNHATFHMHNFGYDNLPRNGGYPCDLCFTDCTVLWDFSEAGAKLQLYFHRNGGKYMIQIMDVKKSFGTEEVLHGITREFEPGKIHGIVGNNGSGKTVLMKCICGFLRPTSGRILVDGKEVGKDMDFPRELRSHYRNPRLFAKSHWIEKPKAACFPARQNRRRTNSQQPAQSGAGS